MRDVEEPPDTDGGPGRAGRLYTPMVEAGCGLRLALFRDRHGVRCAVGFSCAEELERVLGADYVVLPLARRVVRELAAARGVEEILVDPVFAAAPVAVSPATAPTSPSAESGRRMDPQVAGALAVCTAAGVAAVLLGELR